MILKTKVVPSDPSGASSPPDHVRGLSLPPRGSTLPAGGCDHPAFSAAVRRKPQDLPPPASQLPRRGDAPPASWRGLRCSGRSAQTFLGRRRRSPRTRPRIHAWPLACSQKAKVSNPTTSRNRPTLYSQPAPMSNQKLGPWRNYPQLCYAVRGVLDALWMLENCE